MNNEIKMIFPNKSCNERLARSVVSAFVLELDPTAEQLAELKTAVSEAVTNAIIHGYKDMEGDVILECEAEDRTVYITVTDNGRGIENIEKAMEPLYTGSPETERSGMGFTIMEAFSDEIYVSSVVGKGTVIRMKKCFS